jgi:hypothetical protein
MATKPKHQVIEEGQLRVPRFVGWKTASTDREVGPLTNWREAPAYVLLGDPGAGKSASFKAESRACDGHLLNARDVVDDVLSMPPAGKTVFIDGLDEATAAGGGGGQENTAFGAIRHWLHRAGRPRFRLSCREATWLGETDRASLAIVAPSNSVTVLHLEPLRMPGDVIAILEDRRSEIGDANRFLQETERLGLTPMLGNPLLLDLTIKAFKSAKGDELKTRQGIYELSCRQLAKEHNPRLAARRPMGASGIDHLLNDAGLLCAVLLLSGKQWLAKGDATSNQGVSLDAIGRDLRLHDANRALESNLFTTVAGESSPRHRSIAEFLAGKALAKRITEGLPLGRVLALIQGIDGKPVQPLRGLLASLAVHSPGNRERLMHLDPVGMVLSGDIAAFSTSERIEWLKALAKQANQDKLFLDNTWVGHPFGPLATAEMVPTFEVLLDDLDHSEEHQLFMRCVLQALCHGQPLPALAPKLALWVEENGSRLGDRVLAYQAWANCIPKNKRSAIEREWLDQLVANKIKDQDEQIENILLRQLYPKHLSCKEVLTYLRPMGTTHRLHSRPFWRGYMLDATKPSDFPALIDNWAQIWPHLPDAANDYDIRHLTSGLLTRALKTAGDTVDTARLYQWLGICLDKYGHAFVAPMERKELQDWLSARPEKMKAIFQLGYAQLSPDEHGNLRSWRPLQRLYSAQRPSDWFRWRLDFASSTENESHAKDSLQHIARQALEPPAGFDLPTLDELRDWAALHQTKWPKAQDWLDESWTSKLDQWEAEAHAWANERNAQAELIRQARKREAAPYLQSLSSNSNISGFLDNIALAYERQFHEIEGSTPEARVQDFLVTDAETAKGAIAALDGVMHRHDLPSAPKILTLSKRGEYVPFRSAALLAASRQFETNPNIVEEWSDAVAKQLVAFFLTGNTDAAYPWYEMLAVQRPHLVAPLLIESAKSAHKGLGLLLVPALRMLRQGDTMRALGRLVLPELLSSFPARANDALRHELNFSLLAALQLLDDAQAKSIIRTKLAQASVDTVQRISWMVAQLPYRAKAAEDLAKWIGTNERRAVALGLALGAQDSLKRIGHVLAPTAVGQLIKVLAAITPLARSHSEGAAMAENYRRETVGQLLSTLATNPSAEAHHALTQLLSSNRIGNWREAIERSIQTQQSAAREANFRTPSPENVAMTLANVAPANQADLRALVMDHLAEIENSLRRPTFLLRQFWKEDGTKKLPQNENFCRELLVEKLQARLLPMNISANREHHTAGEKRADMWVEFIRNGTKFAIPVEVKQEHFEKDKAGRTIWTAWRDQLQRLYSADPAAAGFGLYLVLWFNHKPPSTPEGVKATSAKHLRDLIVHRIPASEQHHIEVQVLDLSQRPLG